MRAVNPSLLFVIFSSLTLFADAQVTISGKVRDKKETNFRGEYCFERHL